MTKYFFFGIILIHFSLITNTSADACSAFCIKKGNKFLVGSSVDSYMEEPWAFFQPAEDGKYGYVTFLFDRVTFESIQGGFNEHGLVVEGAGLPERSYPGNVYGRPILSGSGSLMHKLLESCSTVEQCIDTVHQYYWPDFKEVHIMVADKFGNSAIIEWGESDLVAIKRNRDYQVMTNFFNVDTLNSRWYGCYRHRVANAIFEESTSVTFNLLKQVCNAVHQEGNKPTQYSNIYDPVKGDVYVFYFHNFNEVVKFNLVEELEKGERKIQLSKLYYKTKAIYPITGETINSTFPTFKWKGNAQNYELQYSISPEFNYYKSIFIANIKTPNQKKDANMAILGIFVLLISGISFKPKKTLVGVAVLVLTIGSFTSCEKNIIYPAEDSVIEHQETVNNLQANTTYYWRVIANDNIEINSGSVVETFITGN